MSWSRRDLLRRTCATALLAVLGGCGFHPVYARRDDPEAPLAALSRIDIATIPERHGQQLRNFLIDRFYRDGRPADPLYRLEIALRTREARLAIQANDTATRAQVIATAAFRLIPAKAAGAVQPALAGTARAVASYNIVAGQYATYASQQDAYDRVLRELGEDVATRLALHLEEPGRS